MEKKLLLGTFYGLIYFLEGALITYFTGFNFIYLRTFEVSFTNIGIISSIALIPFVLKILVGIISDRVNLFGLGYRKPFIVIGLFIEGVFICLVPDISPIDSFTTFATVMFMAAFGMAIFDTATDGYAIDTTPEEHRGFVQGIMVGGRAVGAILTASFIGYITHYHSWEIIFYSIGFVSIIPLAYILIIPDETKRDTEKAFEWGAFRTFIKRPVIMFALLGFLYPMVIYSVEGIVGVFLNEGLGMNMLKVGFATSLFGVGIAIGALFGGFSVDRVGRKRSVSLAITISSIAIAILTATIDPVFAYIFIFIFGAAFGFYETVYFALGMDFSDPRIAATMFAVFMAVGNFGIGLGQAVAGLLVDNLGFEYTFVFFAAINLVGLTMLSVIFRDRVEKNEN